MKKLKMVVLSLLTALMVTACAKGGPSITDAVQQIEKPAQPIMQENNYFLNENNNYFDVDQVTIRPRYIYWDNGTLVAECFVINGLPVSVFNINVNNLVFSNDNVKIAEAGFGVMQNAVIAPYSHVVWTFYFNADCVNSTNADLTGNINCVFNTAYNY